jgi:transposase
VAVVFLRKHVTRYRDTQYVSYRLCRTVREGGTVRQELVANLGKLSPKEAERIGRQLLALAGKDAPQAGAMEQGPAFLYGGPLLVQALMKLADLPSLLEPLGRTRRRLDLVRTLTVALCAQLLAPGSELKTSEWQRKLLWTREPYSIPYTHFLRALDVLADHHGQIELGLFSRVKHLLNQQVDVVFYDLTSSYFEGSGPEGLAQRGYSRDGRGDCPQVVLGLAVTKDGYPIAYRVHQGNTVDAKTVAALSEDLRRQFEIDRCLLVGDSGLLSRENAERLSGEGLGYLLGMRAATTKTAQEAIGATVGQSPAGQVGEVSFWPVQQRAGRAYIVLHSPGREHKTQAILARKLAKARPQLAQLERDVQAGKVRQGTTMASRATRILVEAKATPYFETQARDGFFAYQERTERIGAIQDHGGKYVLETNELTLGAREAAVAYRQLEVAEDSMRHLKDTLRLRPMYHRSPRRVMGHIGLCVLALFLLRLLEERLLGAGLSLPGRQALESAQELLAIPLRLGDRELWPRPHVSATAEAAFRAVGLPDVRRRFREDLEALNLAIPL